MAVGVGDGAFARALEVAVVTEARLTSAVCDAFLHRALRCARREFPVGSPKLIGSHPQYA
ncbi:hypothetical protein D3C72_2112550 [compost metagenome]